MIRRILLGCRRCSSPVETTGMWAVSILQCPRMSAGLAISFSILQNARANKCRKWCGKTFLRILLHFYRVFSFCTGCCWDLAVSRSWWWRSDRSWFYASLRKQGVFLMIYKPVWYFIMYIFSVLNAYFIIPFLIHYGLNHRSKVEQMFLTGPFSHTNLNMTLRELFVQTRWHSQKGAL